MTDSSYIIEADRLGKSYRTKEGDIQALSELTLKVEKGEILGLLGPNGAGKTTGVKIIMGFIRPTSGQVLFKGPAPQSRRSPSANRIFARKFSSQSQSDCF